MTVSRLSSGSPPQVRGKRDATTKNDIQMRITPAGAGKTRERGTHKACRQDHPRRCGENPYVAGIVTCEAGSPPQVRGKLILSIGYGSSRGITPAGAGKTHRLRRCYGFAAGSPPQVRGKPCSKLIVVVSSRITPAGAGKTLIISVIFDRRRDHPRRCGENLYLACGQ